jgi:probable rRNA maturation factor
MIEILNRQKAAKISRERFARLLRRLARRYGLRRPEIALVFVEDREMRRLNRTFRKKDTTTDVLSFPLKEKAADGKYYLGDIIISVPTATKQARELGHSLERELIALTIHGFLHLLGYDHGSGHKKEEAALRALLARD